MTLYRVPKGTGDRPATERDGALPRLRHGDMPAPLAHPWRDYDVVEVPGSRYADLIHATISPDMSREEYLSLPAASRQRSAPVSEWKRGEAQVPAGWVTSILVEGEMRTAEAVEPARVVLGDDGVYECVIRQPGLYGWDGSTLWRVEQEKRDG